MPDDNWHLSKSVPITLIFGLIIQGAAIVWTVSMMMSDIGENTKDIMELSERVLHIEASVHSQAIEMARISENITHIRMYVEKIASDE